MKFRSLLAVALASALVLAATGCGGDEDVADASSPTTVAEDDSAREPSDSTDGSASDDGAADDGDTSGGSSSDDGDSPIGSDSMPDFSQLGECMNAGLAYAGLAFSAMGGPDGAKMAKEAAASMKETLPKDLHDELEVVTKAFASVAEKGIMEGSKLLDSKEFEKADDAISKYFDEVCGEG